MFITDDVNVIEILTLFPTSMIPCGNVGCKLWGRDFRRTSSLGRTGIFHGNWMLILALGVIGMTCLSFVIDVIELIRLRLLSALPQLANASKSPERSACVRLS